MFLIEILLRWLHRDASGSSRMEAEVSREDQRQLQRDAAEKVREVE